MSQPRSPLSSFSRRQRRSCTHPESYDRAYIRRSRKELTWSEIFAKAWKMLTTFKIERDYVKDIKAVCTNQNVTGFSEDIVKKNYSIGPVRNPTEELIPIHGPHVYVMVEEEEAVLTYTTLPEYFTQDWVFAWTFYILTITRLLCFALFIVHELAGSFLPPRRHIIRSVAHVMPIPTAQELQGPLIHGGPLAPDLIRGSEALAAARRAGYTLQL